MPKAWAFRCGQARLVVPQWHAATRLPILLGWVFAHRSKEEGKKKKKEKVRNTDIIWANREITWRLMWKGPHNGFVERLLTHQHCAHRLRKQNWVVNPESQRTNPRSGWERNHADSKKGVEDVNVRDETCGKNWATEKKLSKPAWVLAPPWTVATWKDKRVPNAITTLFLQKW